MKYLQYVGAPITLKVSGHKLTWTIYIYLKKIRRLIICNQKKISNDFNRFELKSNSLTLVYLRKIKNCKNAINFVPLKPSNVGSNFSKNGTHI